MSKGHALLAPSSAGRWLNCTPSARLEATFPESSSRAAEEGTLAHKIAEDTLLFKLGRIQKFVFETKMAGHRSDELFQDEMLFYVGSFVDFVLEQYNAAKSEDPNAVIYLETEVSLAEFIPESWGTLDVRIVTAKKIRIIDLKYGKGVAVVAEENYQLRVYGIGGVLDLAAIYDFETVEMTIHQPRLDSITTVEMSVADLDNWAHSYVVPRAKMAFAGTGDFLPGKHCKFCKAQGICKALGEYNLEIARHEFAESPLLSDEQVSDILDRHKMFIDWVKAVKDYALKQAVEYGKQWPGYKVVEGRANRIYADQDAVVALLTADGYKEDQIWNKKLISITEMEKLIGKKLFKDKLKDLVIKPSGSPTLAPLSDKREPFNGKLSADEDFEDEN